MKLSRRQFTRLATSAVAATLLGACRRATPAPPEGVSSATTAPSLQAPDAAAPAPSGRYRQAPTLDGIEYAHLLPVDDRLPRRPMVLGSEADVGGYGGALRRAILQTTYDRAEPEFRRLVLGQDLSEARQVVDSLDAHKLFAYDHDLVLRPWLCESWEYDEEGVWTLHLREGVRWSDGEPFTLQDVRFALEQSPRIGSEQAREMLRQRFEVVDDHLLRVHRASLDALDNLALIARLSGLIVPSHPMRALFPESADADERQRNALEGLSGAGITPAAPDSAWLMWWEQRSDWRLNPELPTLNPWVLVDGPTADAFTYRRNPYCWQVDVEGRQLPYLDEITFTWTDAAGLRQSLVRGEPDVVDQGLSVGDHAWLRDHLDAGTYDVLQCPSPGHLALQLNLSVPDPAKQALVNDRRVRRAVSLLMQRDTLNLFHYDGLLTPRQLAPVTGGRYANDDLAEALVSHDPVEANRLLDEAGYAERDAEGYRLFPDGERIAWTLLEVSTAQVPSRDAELLAEWLADGGIECHPRPMEQWRFMNAWSQNDWDALYGRVDVPVVPTLQRFGFWTGQTSGVAFWPGLFSSAPLPHAIPPPRDHFLWALWGLWEEYAAASTEDERIALWQAALEIWREELPAIGVLGGMPRPVVARKGLRGLDPTALYAEELGGLGGGWLALFHWAS